MAYRFSFCVLIIFQLVDKYVNIIFLECLIVNLFNLSFRQLDKKSLAILPNSKILNYFLKFTYNSLIASLKYCSLPFTISADAVPDPLQYCLYSSFVSYVSKKLRTQSFHFCTPFLSFMMR